MVIELTKAGHKVEKEKPMEVYYDEGQALGFFSADLYVEDTVVVQLKSVQHAIKDHEVQLVNYLKALMKDIEPVC